MRTLAIDAGEKRIGLALSDAGGTIATPLLVLQVSSLDAAIEPILEVIEREGAERVVVGLPLDMEGTFGAAAKRIAEWGKRLGGRSGLAVVFVDERLSSFAAEQQMAERKRGGEKLTRKRKKQQLDAVAAAGFLREFLDGKLSAVDLPG